MLHARCAAPAATNAAIGHPGIALQTSVLPFQNMPCKRAAALCSVAGGLPSHSIIAAGREPSPSTRSIPAQRSPGAYFPIKAVSSSSLVPGAMFPIQSLIVAFPSSCRRRAGVTP